jgi:GTP-binding protein
MQATAALLRELEQRAAEEEKPQERRRYTLSPQDEQAWEVTRLSKHHFNVSGIGIERFTKMTNFENEEAVERFQRRLDATGISAELNRQGIEDGDVVHIGSFELVWGDQMETGEPVRKERRTARQRLADRIVLADDEVDVAADEE